METSANDSHEIRTIMTRIIGMTDLMLMTDLTEEQLNYLTILKSSTGLLLKSFSAMQDCTKPPTEEIPLKDVSFDIRELLQEVVDSFHIAAKQKSITLGIDSTDNKIPKHLIGDPVRLRQVLSTVLGNGIQFTNNDEVFIAIALVELDKNSMRLKFTVSSTEIGIPEEEGGVTLCFTAVFGVQ